MLPFFLNERRIIINGMKKLVVHLTHPYGEISKMYVVDIEPDASSSFVAKNTIGSNCGNKSKKKYDPIPAVAAPRANNPKRTNAPARNAQRIADTIDKDSFIEQPKSVIN